MGRRKREGEDRREETESEKEHVKRREEKQLQALALGILLQGQQLQMHQQSQERMIRLLVSRLLTSDGSKEVVGAEGCSDDGEADPLRCSVVHCPHGGRDAGEAAAAAPVLPRGVADVSPRGPPAPRSLSSGPGPGAVVVPSADGLDVEEVERVYASPGLQRPLVDALAREPRVVQAGLREGAGAGRGPGLEVEQPGAAVVLPGERGAREHRGGPEAALEGEPHHSRPEGTEQHPWEHRDTRKGDHERDEGPPEARKKQKPARRERERGGRGRRQQPHR